MKTEKIKIEGMSCNHCTSSVDRMITELEGVKKVEVSLEEGTAVVDFDPALIDLSTIISRINQSHYQVVTL